MSGAPGPRAAAHQPSARGASGGCAAAPSPRAQERRLHDDDRPVTASHDRRRPSRLEEPSDHRPLTGLAGRPRRSHDDDQHGERPPVPSFMPDSWQDARREWGKPDERGSGKRSARGAGFASSAITSREPASWSPRSATVNLMFSPNFLWFLFPTAFMSLRHAAARGIALGGRHQDSRRPRRKVVGPDGAR